MKDFLEKRLGIEIMLEDINFEDRLPLLYISLYTFKLVQTYGVEWIIKYDDFGRDSFLYRK